MRLEAHAPAPDQFIQFTSVYNGTTFVWRKTSDYGIGNISPADAAVLDELSTLTATPDEINRNNKASTREVSAAGANLTVTLALHDGKTILLDQATGTAVTLPAMTGSGGRYRFYCSVATSGGSQVITATGAHLFGSFLVGTDGALAAGTLWVTPARGAAGRSHPRQSLG